MGRAHRIRDEIRAMSLRDAVKGVLRGYEENDLLTFASAIAFQILFAIIPLALVGLGLLGAFGLEEQWSGEWRDRARENVSEPVFRVIDDTVERMLTERHVFWVTAGALVAVWEISGAMRAIMDVFDRIYGSRRRRSFAERLRVSLALGMCVVALLLAATASVTLGDDLLRDIGIESALVLWLRWPVALALLLAVVALLVSRAPVDHQPLHWVTFGSVVVVGAWAVTSVVLGWYLTGIAEYGSVFGALATVVIVLSYLYFASVAFLTGAQLDALVRDRVENGVNGG
jgi:membrane protein